MARTQQEIRDALENCIVAPRKAAAAVMLGAAKIKPQNNKSQEVEIVQSKRRIPKAMASSGK